MERVNSKLNKGENHMTRNKTHRSTSIVVDSGASFPSDILLSQHEGLHIVPITVHLGGRSYLDGIDLSPSEFYERLKSTVDTPSTSAPSPAQYLDAFCKASGETESILCLTVSTRFSSSFNSAEIAYRDFRNRNPGTDINILDTRTAAGGEGLVALQSWKAASEGANLTEVTRITNDTISRTTLIAFLDTMYYLWKGGRVPLIAHVGSSLLRIKPLFQLKQGIVRTLARPRTHKKAMERILTVMEERVGLKPLHALVMHADAEDDAEEIKQRIQTRFHCKELYVSECTPTMGAHIGPGLLGVAFWTG